jgi:hypothetical protein
MTVHRGLDGRTSTKFIASRCRLDENIHVKLRQLMHRVFQLFIDGLTASGDAESLRAVLAEAGAALDLSCFAYLSLPARRGDPPQLISTYPAKWTDHYLQQSYERFDPVIVEALATTEPFEWGHEFSSTPLSKSPFGKSRMGVSA